MEMRASQVIKGALGGGAKKREREKDREEKERERETPSNAHCWRGVEAGMSQICSDTGGYY